MPPVEQNVLNALEPVIDPELGLSIVDLGLVYDVDITPEGAVQVTFTTTTPSCPLGEMIGYGIYRAVSRLSGVTGVSVRLVLDPPWSPDRLSPMAAERLAGVL